MVGPAHPSAQHRTYVGVAGFALAPSATSVAVHMLLQRQHEHVCHQVPAGLKASSLARLDGGPALVKFQGFQEFFGPDFHSVRSLEPETTRGPRSSSLVLNGESVSLKPQGLKGDFLMYNFTLKNRTLRA